MVRRDGARVRCFTRNGHDWADRFPAIVDAASRIQIEHDGDDLRDLPLIKRKRRLAKLIGKAKRRAIRFTEHGHDVPWVKA